MLSYRVQQAPSGRRESPAIVGETAPAPPMRFLSPTACPRTGQRHEVAGFASPDRLHLQVFSTSWRFHPPRACRPYFVPDPLMGFRPPELCSSRAAVRRLRRRYPHAVGRGPCRYPFVQPERIRKNARNRLPRNPDPTPRLQGLAPHESPPHTNGCLGRKQRVALLGFRPPGFSPPLEWHDFHRASPHGLGSTARKQTEELPSRVSLPAGLARLLRDRLPSWALPPHDHHEHSDRTRFGSHLLRPRGASPSPASHL
jgi:hypothetical protein